MTRKKRVVKKMQLATRLSNSVRRQLKCNQGGSLESSVVDTQSGSLKLKEELRIVTQCKLEYHFLTKLVA